MAHVERWVWKKKQRFDVPISEGCGVSPQAKHIRGTYREEPGKDRDISGVDLRC